MMLVARGCANVQTGLLHEDLEAARATFKPSCFTSTGCSHCAARLYAVPDVLAANGQAGEGIEQACRRS